MSDARNRSGLTSLADYQQYVPGRVLHRDDEEGGSDLRLRSWMYSAAEPPAPVPALPQHTLTFVYAGAIEGGRRTGGGAWRSFDTTARGHVTLRPAGRSTTLRWRARRPVRTVSLYLAPDRLEETGLEMGVAPSRVELPDAFNRRDPVLRRLAGALREVAAGRRADDPLYRQTALQALTVRLLRRHGTADLGAAEAGQLSRARFHRVERVVRARLGTDLSLDDLAGAVGLSKYHFSRRFKRRTGQSPYQFVIYERVRAARRRLRKTTQPLAQIALAVGFSSQSHLTRTFRRHVGTTPGRYRQAWC
jgi:AraC family transcriptional regulator